MLTKQQLTEKIIQLSEKEISCEEAMRQWWADPRNNQRFRLSKEGYQILCELEFEHYKFEGFSGIWSSFKHISILNQYLTCPYYIEAKKKTEIVIFGSKQAVEIILHGDLEKFLSSLDNN